jgi:DNA-binding transcriptional regulator LsrR (DeoR family)
MLPTPGILGTAQAKEALMADPAIDEVRRLWGQLTLALVGIGGTEPSDLAARSGNVFPDDDRAALTKAGAVGDVCFRFFDSSGEHIHSSFDNRVIGIDPQTLKAVPRRVAVAGGARKVSAIRGAMLGNWINVLVTDKATAEALVDAPSSKGFN